MAELQDIVHSLDVLFLFNSSVLVFFMQTGFCMLEAGSIQRKNIRNILMKNLVDTCFAGLGFWLVGFAIAFGSGDDFAGSSWEFVDLQSEGLTNSPVRWFFQFGFCVTASTIVSGCVAGRMKFEIYCVVALLMSTVLHPVIAHWLWGKGFFEKNGAIDYAGGLAVHVTGGVAGLVCAILVGPRTGRFEGPRFRVIVNPLPPFSSVFGCLGTLILWIGWYGFNCGSVISVSTRMGVASLISINTTLGAVGGVLGGVLSSSYPKFSAIDIRVVLNGALTGLVSITPGCSVMSPWAALVCGIVGGAVYTLASKLLEQLRVDDPVDAAAVHLFGGMWGTLAVGLFAEPAKIARAFSQPSLHTNAGLFFGDHSAKLLGWQALGVLCTILWVGGSMTVVQSTLKRLFGIRVDTATERIGLDAALHGNIELPCVALQCAMDVLSANPALTPTKSKLDLPEV